MKEDCLFCKIINGDIPSDKVYEDEYVYAFKDINPVAPFHVLVVPKTHMDNVNDIDENNVEYVSKIFLAIKKIAKENNIVEKGYKVISNCGKEAGQTVMHIHFHIISGDCFGKKV